MEIVVEFTNILENVLSHAMYSIYMYCVSVRTDMLEQCRSSSDVGRCSIQSGFTLFLSSRGFNP